MVSNLKGIVQSQSLAPLKHWILTQKKIKTTNSYEGSIHPSRRLISEYTRCCLAH